MEIPAQKLRLPSWKHFSVQLHLNRSSTLEMSNPRHRFFKQYRILDTTLCGRSDAPCSIHVNARQEIISTARDPNLRRIFTKQ